MQERQSEQTLDVKGIHRMSDLPPAFSSGKPIQGESVTFVVDTNILIEFEPLAQIDWRLLCPSTKSISIVVPSTVVREMDKHKRSTPRIRRRALDFNKLLIEIEDGNGQDATLQSDHVALRLILMPRYAENALPQEKLSFEVADDLIVAETLKFIQNHPDAIFLADDNNARRTAREMGIQVARPAEEWRRTEAKDPRDARIDELERQLGAMPRLSLALLTGEVNEVAFETLHPEAIPDTFCDRVANLILEKNPGYSRDELLERHNLSAVQNNLRFSPSNLFSVSVDDIEKYCRNYQQFKERVTTWSRQLPEILSQLDFVAPIQFEISNEGDAFAEHVEVTVSVSTGYSFTHDLFIQSYLDIGCKPPDPPSKGGLIPHIPNFFEQQRLHQKDPFNFYLGKAPEQDRLISDISYECERFRHGSSDVLSSILLKDDGPSGGLLNVRASSASLADLVDVRYPISVKQEQRSENFKEHLWQRLFFFPKEVRDSIAVALEDF